MTLLRVIAPSAQFSHGIIGLSPEQALDRLHNLNDLGDDTYEILRTIEFRVGEVVDYAGDINPRLLEVVELAAVPLEDMTAKEIAALAAGEGCTLDARRKKADLIQALTDFRSAKAAQAAADAQAAQDAAAKSARIQELEAKGDTLTPEETAELAGLKA